MKAWTGIYSICKNLFNFIDTHAYYTTKKINHKNLYFIKNKKKKKNSYYICYIWGGSLSLFLGCAVLVACWRGVGVLVRIIPFVFNPPVFIKCIVLCTYICMGVHTTYVCVGGKGWGCQYPPRCRPPCRGKYPVG